MKYMMIFSYDGSKFYGFQRQNNFRSVQSEVELALKEVLKEDVLVKGSGRTDRGVHAKYQVVHFETNKKISNLKYKLNKVLKDIKIRKIKLVESDFHARYSVKSKTYVYKVDLKNRRNKNYYLLIKYKVDINKIKEASKLFLGTHNFKNFVSGERNNYISTIYSIGIYKFNGVLYFKFKGIGFYRYMVRNLVGALLEVGKGKIDKRVINDMLVNYDVSKRLATASPNGLYLSKIIY